MSNTARRHSPQCEGRALGPEGVGGGGGDDCNEGEIGDAKILQPHVLMIKRPAHSNSHRSNFQQ